MTAKRKWTYCVRIIDRPSTSILVSTIQFDRRNPHKVTVKSGLFACADPAADAEAAYAACEARLERLMGLMMDRRKRTA